MVAAARHRHTETNNTYVAHSNRQVVKQTLVTCNYIVVEQGCVHPSFVKEHNLWQSIDCLQSEAAVHSPMHRSVSSAVCVVGQIVHEHTRLTCMQSYNSKIMQHYRSPLQDKNHIVATHLYFSNTHQCIGRGGSNTWCMIAHRTECRLDVSPNVLQDKQQRGLKHQKRCVCIAAEQLHLMSRI